MILDFEGKLWAWAIFVCESEIRGDDPIMAIEIEYCEQWNYRPEADRVSAEIEKITGQKVTLVGGSGGIFEIRQDSKVIWKKERSGHFPLPGEAGALF